MDEMTRLRELRAQTPAPARARLAAGRPPLLHGVAPGGRPRLAGGGAGPWRTSGRARALASDWRIASLGAAVAITAAALLATHIGAEPIPDMSSMDKAASRSLENPVEVLQRAAGAVAKQPSVPEPAPDQWIYSKRVVDQADQGDARSDVSVSVDHDPEAEDWTPYANPAAERDRSDDDRSAREIYRIAEALPDDPEKALIEARRLYPTGDGKEMDPEPAPEHSFRALRVMAESYPLSSKSLAKIYRAMAAIPGIDVGEQLVRDAAGREAIAITVRAAADAAKFAQDGSTELLIDPENYRYLGFRHLAASGHSSGTPNEMNETGHRIDKGDVLYSEARTDVAVVDAEGRTP
ncbi:hypothetical protein GCM10010387_44870 [Streptomyces inusitatus]|uniref:CU044_5270 family protein n=1 Tax=Streptomyces inusitatus TaxID=68221 RepID=A0A918QF41_9ACTN|nr:CU044_5270 family protein [Streptomyces inusitatus]GGZ45390.1 hypothetical protein GCM10010387_44870 [Streptomyces inusitatus]